MKGEGFWVAGTGFSAVQIFFYLEKWYSYAIYTAFCLLCLLVWQKFPKELKLIYWIVVTLIFTVLYYWLKPANEPFIGL